MRSYLAECPVSDGKKISGVEGRRIDSIDVDGALKDWGSRGVEGKAC